MERGLEICAPGTYAPGIYPPSTSGFEALMETAAKLGASSEAADRPIGEIDK